MDVRMPELDGIAATRTLTETGARARIVILTTFEDDAYIFDALRAGASGFLLKRTHPEDLIAAVHTVTGGESLLSPSVTTRVIERVARQPSPTIVNDDSLAELTPRERDVFMLAARGLSNRDIARELVLEESTIRTHIKHILMKLCLRDRVQIVIYASETGVSRPAVDGSHRWAK
jgi:DNA-binding NarL/FixJ family response regulator